MEPFFLDGGAGPLFAIYQPPRDGSEPQVVAVHCPAFAEEMNKSRRMVSLQARAWAADGIGTLVVDLFGTGDSAGDFGDATWSEWRQDIAVALTWARARCRRVWLWGLRGGALLAAAAAAERGSVSGFSGGGAQEGGAAADAVERLVLWQPVLRGDAWLTQFLRLRTAAALFRGGEKETVKDLQARLRAGETVEVAGYSLSPGLASELAGEELGQRLRAVSCPITWLEVSAQPEGGLPPASARLYDALRAEGLVIDSRVVAGESFWATQEIATAPELLIATPCAG